MSLADELNKLEQLHRRGTINDDEFALAKARLIQEQPIGAVASDPRSGDDDGFVRREAELSRLDREWQIRRQDYMMTGKYGRQYMPTPAGGIVTAVVGGGFGCFWTIMAFSITGGMPGGGPFGIASVVFPFVGILITCGAVAMGVYTYHRGVKYQTEYAEYQQKRRAITGEPNPSEVFTDRT